MQSVGNPYFPYAPQGMRTCLARRPRRLHLCRSGGGEGKQLTQDARASRLLKIRLSCGERVRFKANYGIAASRMLPGWALALSDCVPRPAAAELATCSVLFHHVVYTAVAGLHLWLLVCGNM